MKAPLEGVTVIDLTEIIAGPYCTSILGAMGAKVIKVERPGRGDNYRLTDEIFPRWNSTYFVGVNHSKESLALDITSEKGKEILYELVKKADVFIESYRPSSVKKMGIDYTDIKELNPQIIYCSMTAFGEEGPLKDAPGMDITIQAYSGIMGITGEPEGGPVRVGAPVCDVLAALSASTSILLALMTRKDNGAGQKISISLLEAQVAAMANYVTGYFATGKEVERVGSGHPHLAPYQAFKAKDNYIMLGCLSEKLWLNLCKALNMEYLAEDPKFERNHNRVANRKELVNILEDVLKEQTVEYWLELFNNYDVPCAPVNSLGQALKNPQLETNETVVDLEHPLAGPVKILGLPFKLHNTPTKITKPAPLLGENTIDILKELNYETEEIESFLDENVVEAYEKDDIKQMMKIRNPKDEAEKS